MPVKILNTVDITSDVLSITDASGSIDTIQGILSESRTYTVADNDNRINFVGGGLYFSNSWRGTALSETNDAGAKVFEAIVDKVKTRREDRGFLSIIEAKSPLTTVLEWPVEANDSTSISGYEVDGAHSIGDNVISVKNGTGIISPKAQTSFTESIVPRYQIVDQVDNGSITTSITLGRGLEKDLTDGDDIRVTLPEMKSGAQIIFDAFVAIDAVSEIDLLAKIGSSFAAISAADVAAGRLLWVHTRIEDNFKLKDFLALILELTDMEVTVSEEGIIDLVRGRAYQGNLILNEITTSEIIPPYEFFTEKANLVIGYDLLYMDDTTQEARVASGDVDDSLIIEYEGRQRWNPIKLQGATANPFDYRVLYNDAATADFFGESRLAYYGHARIRVECMLKQSETGKPLKRIIPQLRKEFALSIKSGVNRFFVAEPARVVGFRYDNGSLRYSSVTFELSNFPSPNLVRDKTIPTTPVLLSIAGAQNGFIATFEAFSGTLFVDIFLEDKAWRILNDQAVNCFDNDDDLDGCFSNQILSNGFCYNARFYTAINGIKSSFTDFFEFCPEVSKLLQESGDAILQENGDFILLE